MARVILVASLRSDSDIWETAAVSAESTTATAAGWQGSGVGGFSQFSASPPVSSWYSGLSTTIWLLSSGPLLPCGDLVFAEGVGIRHVGYRVLLYLAFNQTDMAYARQNEHRRQRWFRLAVRRPWLR